MSSGLVRVSVLMGIYNCALTLREALDSLYAQTYQDFKIILCDDGSTDDTYAIAKEYGDAHQNIVLIRNEQNKGLNFTLNRCLEFADTEYCARMDGDDVSLPTRFEKEVAFLDSNPDFSIVSCPMFYFDENGVFRKGIGKGEIYKSDFLNGSPICHAPSMIRTSSLKKVGGYAVDKRLLRVEDYNLWMRMYAEGYKAYMLPEALYKMRDDRNAKRRRNWRGRMNEMYAMNTGFRLLGFPWYCQLYALRPLLAHIAPGWLYNLYHRK